MKIFSDQLGFNAEKSLDISKINYKLINVIEQYPELLKTLDNWVLISDKKFIPDLIKLNEIIKKYKKDHNEKINETLKVYRGFVINNFNEKLDLTRKDIVGSKHNFKSNFKALSFTTDFNIAKAFSGNECIIETIFTKKDLYLEFIPELDFLLNKIRNLKHFSTQKEVILLPPFDIDFKIIQMNNPSFWLKW